MTSRTPESSHPVDWESFYRSYRKPGYVPGFEITTRLGTGAFGLVYRAVKQSIGKDYAIKFLKVDDEQSRDVVVRELEIAKVCAQIDDPNLVPIEDLGVVDGIPYVVMGFAGDTTLKALLDRGPLVLEEARRVALQVARGLAALHRHGLVHFDLKPANVFLRGDVARLGDYGLSRIVTGSRQSLSVGRGTPYYMAPELVRRRGDARSDVYSFGVLLYECLSGRVPFQGENEWEVLQRHERDAVQWPASIPAFVRPLLARCLEKDPARRFGDGVELLSALQACSAPGMRANAAGASTTTSDAAGMDDPVAFVVKASAARLRRGNGPALEMSDLGSRRPTRSWFLAVGLLVILVYGFKRARSADHRYGAVVWDSGAVAVAATPLPVPAAFAFAPEEAVAIAPEPGIDWVARGEEISASVIEYLERSRWITADVAAEARRLRKEILRHCR